MTHLLLYLLLSHTPGWTCFYDVTGAVVEPKTIDLRAARAFDEGHDLENEKRAVRDGKIPVLPSRNALFDYLFTYFDAALGHSIFIELTTGVDLEDLLGPLQIQANIPAATRNGDPLAGFALNSFFLVVTHPAPETLPPRLRQFLQRLVENTAIRILLLRESQ